MVTISKNRQRLGFRRFKTPFQDDGRRGVDVWDVGDLGYNGHLGCQCCMHPYFLTEYTFDGKLLLACDHCKEESEIRNIIFNHSTLKHGLEDPNHMMPGEIRCPYDKCKRFALIKYGSMLSLGCRSCEFQWLANLDEKGNLLYDEFKINGSKLIV